MMQTRIQEKLLPERRNSDALFFFCFLAYTFSYFGRYNYSACLSDMVDGGFLDKGFGGIISSAYLVFYGMGQFINGRLGVKISPNILVATGLFGSGISNILMGCISEKYLFLAVWAANGFFNSMLWSPIVRIFTDWIIESRRSRAGTDISLTIPVGMTLSYVISSVMLEKSSWRGVFLACGSLVFIGGILWVSGIARLKPYINFMKEKCLLAVSNADETAVGGRFGFKHFFGAGVVFVAVVAVFNGSLKDAVQSWAPTYLGESCGFSSSSASLVSSLLPLFSVLGPYVAVYADEHIFKNELLTVSVFFGLAAACFTVTAFFGSSLPFLAVVLPALSMCLMWGVNTVIMTFVPYRFGKMGISSAVSGTLNCVAYISASACAVLYGNVSESKGWFVTVLLWAVMAVFGAIFGLCLAYPWRKRRPQ